MNEPRLTIYMYVMSNQNNFAEENDGFFFLHILWSHHQLYLLRIHSSCCRYIEHSQSITTLDIEPYASLVLFATSVPQSFLFFLILFFFLLHFVLLRLYCCCTSRIQYIFFLFLFVLSDRHTFLALLDKHSRKNK